MISWAISIHRSLKCVVMSISTPLLLISISFPFFLRNFTEITRVPETPIQIFVFPIFLFVYFFILTERIYVCLSAWDNENRRLVCFGRVQNKERYVTLKNNLAKINESILDSFLILLFIRGNNGIHDLGVSWITDITLYLNVCVVIEVLNRKFT